MHIALRGAVARCFVEASPSNDASTQTEEAAGACRHRSCYAQKQKLRTQLTSATSELAALSRKVQTAESKAEREWRGMLKDSQEDTAEAVRRLRDAQNRRACDAKRVDVLEGERTKLQQEVKSSVLHVQQAQQLQADAEARVVAVETSARLAKQQYTREARQAGREALGAEREIQAESFQERLDQLQAEVDAAENSTAAAEERGDNFYKELRNVRRSLNRARGREDKLLSTAAPVYKTDKETDVSKATHDNRRSKWYRCYSAWLVSSDWDEDSLYALSKALYKTGMLDAIWGTRWMDILYVAHTNTLIGEMEQQIFGVRFGLYLHLEMHLTLSQIVDMSLVTFKDWDGKRYGSRHVYESAGSSSRDLKIRPIRITPTRCELEAELLERKAGTDLEMSVDGRVTFRPFLPQIGCLLAEDSGKNGMPELDEFLSKRHVLDIKLSADATGFGALQLSLLTLGNPWSAQSAQTLRILGGGNCDDGRDGVLKLLGDNRDVVNRVIRSKGKTPITVPFPNGDEHEVLIHCIVISDLSCLRHCEKQLNSGLCGCAATALRVVPKKPSNIDELRAHTRRCFRPNLKQRTTLRHARQLDGSIVPCFAAECSFGKSSDPELEYTVAVQHEQQLLADRSKKGIAVHTKWRLDHGHKHYNVQPLQAGEGTFDVDMSSQQYLCNLHGPLLNLPKHSPWSHGILRNASDDGAAAISETLKLMKHPLDCRKKDAGRVKQEKWFTGERYQTFVKGGRGSPGGPKAMAQVVMCLATDLMKQRDRIDPSAPMAAPSVAAAPSRGSGKGGIASRFQGFGPAPANSSTAAPAASPSLTQEQLRVQARAKTEEGRAARLHLLAAPSAPSRQPTAMERACDAQDLQLIKRHYGVFAQIIINALLVWDAAFKLFWVQSEQIGWRCAEVLSVKHALELCAASIDLQEIGERVSLQQCKSWYNHLWIYQMVDHILATGEPLSISDLELLNGLLKRTAKSNATTRIELSEEAQKARAEAEAAAAAAEAEENGGDEEDEEVETVVVQKKRPYSSTMSWQVITFLVLQQEHRKDADAIRFRTAERLFGEEGPGRSSLPKKQKLDQPLPAVVFEKGLHTYVVSGGRVDISAVEPRADSCIKAFCRLLKFAEAQAAAPTAAV